VVKAPPTTWFKYTEEYNGSAWTSWWKFTSYTIWCKYQINDGRNQTAAIAFGGGVLQMDPPLGVTFYTTEEYDGTAWTTVLQV
jgi:hypothetical protein